MILRIVDRINLIREREELNKSQFERKILKSTGYVNMLEKKSGQPGADVILDIIQAFPNYNLKWLMTGEGEMLIDSEEKKGNTAKEPKTNYDIQDRSLTILDVRDDLKRDLRAISEGMIKNFETISEGIFQGLKEQQKIINFIDRLNAEDIAEASKGLNEFLREKGVPK